MLQIVFTMAIEHPATIAAFEVLQLQQINA